MLASSHVQTIYEIYCQADIFSQKKFTTAHHTLLHSFEWIFETLKSPERYDIAIFCGNWTDDVWSCNMTASDLSAISAMSAACSRGGLTQWKKKEPKTCMTESESKAFQRAQTVEDGNTISTTESALLCWPTLLTFHLITMPLMGRRQHLNTKVRIVFCKARYFVPR